MRKNHGYIEGLKFAEEASMGLENQSKAYMSETRNDKEIEAFRQGMADYFKHREYVREWTDGLYGLEPGDQSKGVKINGESTESVQRPDDLAYTSEIREQSETEVES